jgi:hypothetical protein
MVKYVLQINVLITWILYGVWHIIFAKEQVRIVRVLNERQEYMKQLFEINLGSEEDYELP